MQARREYVSEKIEEKVTDEMRSSSSSSS